MNTQDKTVNGLTLNLLNVFNELYKHRNTSEVAKRLGISRTAVSNALKRLRDLLGDPLFIRVGNAFEPTARADKLGENLDQQLTSLLSNCYPPESFNPATFNGHLRLAITPHLLDSLGSNILLSLYQQLPHAKISLTNWHATTSDDIEKGRIDFGITHSPYQLKKSIRQLNIVSDPVLMLMHSAHPLAQTELTDNTLSGQQFCGLISPGLNEHRVIVEQQINDLNIGLMIRSENLSTLYRLLQQSDLMLLAPSIPAANRPKSIICKSITQVEKFSHYSFKVSVNYHYRNHQQPLYLWVEAQLKTLITNQAQQALIDCDCT